MQADGLFGIYVNSLRWQTIGRGRTDALDCFVPVRYGSFRQFGMETGMTLTSARRIIVIGSSNAGKSTLANRLAGLLDVPFIDLDALFWEPNWVEPAREVFRDRVTQATARGSWVMAGNYINWQQDVSWPLADTIIWLDLPLSVVLWRGIRRTWGRYRSQELLWGTNRENFWEHLMLWNTKRSLISHTITRHRGRRREFEAMLHDPRWSHISFVRLRSAEEVERWVRNLESELSLTRH